MDMRPLRLEPEPVRIPSGGAVLTGALLRPAGTPRAAVVLHGATGVPMGYYRAFAQWLAAERGLAVLTYDYRDFGTSATGPMRGARASMVDWGLHDQAAAVGMLGRLVPDVPRWVIGHSLGGVMLGFHAAMAGVARVITVGSGLVHVSDHPPGFRAMSRVFWHAMPPVARLAGYLPGRLTGFGPDLPLEVYRDWRRWCLTPGFHLRDVGGRLPMWDMGLVTADMRIVAVSDDVYVPPKAVWRLMTLYPQALKRQKVLRPADFGLPKIGHLGVFSRANAVVWPALVD